MVFVTEYSNVVNIVDKAFDFVNFCGVVKLYRHVVFIVSLLYFENYIYEIMYKKYVNQFYMMSIDSLTADCFISF